MKHALVLAFSFFALCGSMAEETIGNFTLWQGLLSEKDGRIARGEETTKVPYITKAMDPGFGHGFVLRSNDGSDFTGRVHVQFPKPVKTRLPNGSLKEVSEYDSEPRNSKRGIYLNIYKFDEGDPHGVFKVTIFVNDTKLTELEFDVQPPQ